LCPRQRAAGNSTQGSGWLHSKAWFSSGDSCGGPRSTIFGWGLKVLAEEGLLKGNTVAIDGTTLEANAALRSIVRRNTGEAYDDFLKRLAKESGIEIGLSEAQKTYLHAEVLKAQTRFTELQWQLQDELEELRGLLKQSKADEAQVLVQLDKVLASEREIKRAQMSLLVRIKNNLTEPGNVTDSSTVIEPRNLPISPTNATAPLTGIARRASKTFMRDLLFRSCDCTSQEVDGAGFGELLIGPKSSS